MAGRVQQFALSDRKVDQAPFVPAGNETGKMPGSVAVVKFQFPEFVFRALVKIHSRGFRRLHDATLQRVGVDRPQHPDNDADKKYCPHRYYHVRELLELR